MIFVDQIHGSVRELEVTAEPVHVEVHQMQPLRPFDRTGTLYVIYTREKKKEEETAGLLFTHSQRRR